MHDTGISMSIECAPENMALFTICNYYIFSKFGTLSVDRQTWG